MCFHINFWLGVFLLLPWHRRALKLAGCRREFLILKVLNFYHLQYSYRIYIFQLVHNLHIFSHTQVAGLPISLLIGKADFSRWMRSVSHPFIFIPAVGDECKVIKTLIVLSVKTNLLETGTSNLHSQVHKLFHCPNNVIWLVLCFYC